MSQEILMERMTWQEIEKALNDGWDTVVVMSGSIEQHGPHLPIATDTLLGYSLAEMVAQKMGKTLVAPVIRPGLSEHHMAFKGSLTLTRSTFMAVVREVVDCLVRHGFKKVVILSSHGGNFGALTELVKQLAAEFPQIEILSSPEMGAEFEQTTEVGAKDGIDKASMGVHAGEEETSMLLAYAEDQVRKDRLALGYVGTMSDKEHDEMITHGLHTITKNGVLGDARLADKERGKKYTDLITTNIVNGLVRIKPEGK
jgi:creatinine amidohydrolase/Fe(II)-dependent formamide hydrolase-like protein